MLGGDKTEYHRMISCQYRTIILLITVIIFILIFKPAYKVAGFIMTLFCTHVYGIAIWHI